MNKDTIITNLLEKKGQYSSVSWERPVKTQKEFSNRNIRKRTTMVCRAGINYDNLSIVKEKRASGVLPETNAGLPSWQEWDTYPYLLQKKTDPDKKYIRLYPPDKSSIKVEYFFDGNIVVLDEILNCLLSTELAKDEYPDCITVGLEHMIYLS